MKISRTILGVIYILLPIALLVNSSTASSAPVPPPTSIPDETGLIENAVYQAIKNEKASALITLLYDTRVENIQISPDGLWATAWLVPVDPQTGHDIHVETGLAIVSKSQDSWQATLPSDPKWMELVSLAPLDIITEDAKNNLLLEANAIQESTVTTAYGGYKLPWAVGETMSLTQSTAHDRYTPSGNAHYSFDFAKPGYPSGMFNVHAAKSAKVKKAVWTYANGSTSEPGNYLLLEDTSTSPTTYQLYLHLAQNSIPLELRVYGAPVQQGQFIGIADDTGMSTGNHLHFMVHTYAYSYWGHAVDIVFSDVSINGGRPRIPVDISYCYDTDPCSQTQYNYVSGNITVSDTIPPVGSIVSPAHNTTINSSNLHLEGWAFNDDSGLASAQFKVKYNNSWHLIGNTFSTAQFSMDWDLCANNVPDGPVSLALELRDKAGNPTPDLPGLQQITKNFCCPQPPPTCAPNNDQIALFADPDFQGACVTLGVGNFSNASALGSLGGDNAASIQVGTNVRATLFSNDSYLGRGETFLGRDSNLADNPIGANTVSAVQVQNLNTLPATPRLVYPASSAIFTNDASLSLAWENAGGATQFQARLLLNNIEVQNSGWRPQTSWHISSLPTGNYTWQTKAANSAGESAWSTRARWSFKQITLLQRPAQAFPTFKPWKPWHWTGLTATTGI